MESNELGWHREHKQHGDKHGRKCLKHREECGNSFLITQKYGNATG
jgi:hypothetical protein